jgi:hypothetical protein
MRLIDDQIRKVQFFTNTATWSGGAWGDAAYKSILTGAFSAGKKLFKKFLGISKANVLAIKLNEAFWCASFTLTCICLSLQHFMLFAHGSVGADIFTEASNLPQ